MRSRLPFAFVGLTVGAVLVIGLLAMTTEFRHGTIGRTLQFTPSRTRVVVRLLRMEQLVS